jgi:hypothetical protein
MCPGCRIQVVYVKSYQVHEQILRIKLQKNGAFKLFVRETARAISLVWSTRKKAANNREMVYLYKKESERGLIATRRSQDSKIHNNMLYLLGQCCFHS